MELRVLPKAKQVKELICKTFRNGNLNDIDTLALINGNIKCSRVSYYKFKKELIESQQTKAESAPNRGYVITAYPHFSAKSCCVKLDPTLSVLTLPLFICLYLPLYGLSAVRGIVILPSAQNASESHYTSIIRGGYTHLTASFFIGNFGM